MIRKKLYRMLYLYVRLMGQNFKALMGFHADFTIMLVASAFTQLLGIAFLWVIYKRIPDINGWEFWEVTFIYAMIYFTEGFGSLFFEGTWNIGGLVNRGELDRMLVRPVSPILQVITSRVGINGISNIVIGMIIIVQSFQHVHVEWTPLKVFMTIVLMISAIVIRVAINFTANSATFWTHLPNNSFSLMVHSVSDFAKYPITIYSFGLQAFVTAVIPFAFISFFPAAYIFGKGNIGVVGLISPIIAIYCCVVAVTVFNRGLGRYESAGN